MANTVHLTRQVGTYAVSLCGRSLRVIESTREASETTCKTCLKRLAEIEG